jgi:hypothetical protein
VLTLPRDVIWQRRTVSTGIFKEPVEGPVMLRTLNLDGDRLGKVPEGGGSFPDDSGWRPRPMPASLRDLGFGGGLHGAEAPGFMPAPLRGFP